VPLAARDLDVQYGVATFTLGRAVEVVDLASGRTVCLASPPAVVTAQIEAPGVVYARRADGRGQFRFVPFARVTRMVRRI
jgi:hypothetical protein